MGETTAPVNMYVAVKCEGEAAEKVEAAHIDAQIKRAKITWNGYTIVRGPRGERVREMNR